MSGWIIGQNFDQVFPTQDDAEQYAEDNDLIDEEIAYLN
jgi:hypothetical protein